MNKDNILVMAAGLKRAAANQIVIDLVLDALREKPRLMRRLQEAAIERGTQLGNLEVMQHICTILRIT